MTYLLIFGVCWLFFSALVGALAVAFDRSGGIFFLASLVVSPLLALILLVVVGKGDSSESRSQPQESVASSEEGQTLSGVGILFSAVLIILFVLLGAAVSLKISAVTKPMGFFGGITAGGIFAYGTTWIFPDHMTG